MVMNSAKAAAEQNYQDSIPIPYDIVTFLLFFSLTASVYVYDDFVVLFV